MILTALTFAWLYASTHSDACDVLGVRLVPQTFEATGGGARLRRNVARCALPNRLSEGTA